MNSKLKSGLLVGLTLLSISGMLFLDPIKQDPHYHNFADQRSMLNVANFLNVVSNIGFVFAGFAGLSYLLKNQPPKPLVPVYLTLFLGIALTGLGSAYYHLQPDNATLVWDRLPMTLVFMSFLTAVIGERINLKAGVFLFPLLLLAGISSVWWWYYSEQQGHGDLRAYAFIQFFPVILIPLIMVLFQKPDHSLRLLLLVIGLYVVAKLCEHFDSEILGSLTFISGHSLKHLFAALATWYMVGIYKTNYYQPFRFGFGRQTINNQP